MSQMKISKEELDKYDQLRTWGDVSAIAARYHYTHAAISQALRHGRGSGRLFMCIDEFYRERAAANEIIMNNQDNLDA